MRRCCASRPTWVQARDAPRPPSRRARLDAERRRRQGSRRRPPPGPWKTAPVGADAVGLDDLTARILAVREGEPRTSRVAVAHQEEALAEAQGQVDPDGEVAAVPWTSPSGCAPLPRT